MNKKITYFTSEHVSPGHSDKMMDSIAEAVVSEYLIKDPASRVAVDGAAKNNEIILMGEVTSTATVDIEAITKKVVSLIGYTKETSPLFNDSTINVSSIFTTQSPDIALGVDREDSAGDIGIMFGGAVREAPDFTCHSHYLARLLSYKIYKAGFKWAKPDQKTQVTIGYIEQDGVKVPHCIDSVVVCISHDTEISLKEIEIQVASFIYPILEEYAILHNLTMEGIKMYINPTGSFTVYGTIADSGLVGRKIVCDQYGGYFPVGGGNLNGKDATKVDRSGVYMARFVAKQVLLQNLADKCRIQVSYAIGMKDPISIEVECFGTERVSKEIIQEFVNQFSFRPGDIIIRFNLRDAIKVDYLSLGMYGHIGERFDSTEALPWERYDSTFQQQII